MKITRSETKLHDEAEDLLKLSRELSEDEQEFIYRNWNPMANHNVGKGGIFFTPVALAEEYANYAGGGSITHYIDLCAGIGMLTWAVQKHDRNPNAVYVCLEINHDFVEIGKKLCPWAYWYEGSIFDIELLKRINKEHGPFHYAFSNPPFGNIPTSGDEWLKTNGGFHWKAIEIAVRMAIGGMFILPDQYCDYDLKENKYRDPLPSVKFLPKFPGIYLAPVSLDMSMIENVDWKGTNPHVAFIDIMTDDVTWQRPFGLGEVVKQDSLF